MSKTYSAGIVTAYGAAKRAGYQGTYEDFCRQQAQYAQNASAVEQAKTDAINAKNDAVTAKNTAVSAKDDAVSAKNTAVSAKDTAVSKASEASASATSAGQSATNAAASATAADQSASDAQDVLDSIPADYSDLSEDVGQLKADLVSITGAEIYDFSSAETGFYRLGGTAVDITNIGSGADYKHIAIDCAEGDTFVISGKSYGAAARMYAFVDTNYNILSKATQNAELTSEIINAPSNTARLLVNDYKSTVKVIKDGNINSHIEKTEQQLQAITKSIGVYKNSFTSTGSAHSSLSDEFPVDIKEGENFNVTVAIDINPSANSMQVFGIKEDSTYAALVTGRFNTEYTIIAPDDIKRIGIAIGAQDTAYICTVTIETEQSLPFISEKVTNIENTLDGISKMEAELTDLTADLEYTSTQSSNNLYINGIDIKAGEEFYVQAELESGESSDLLIYANSTSASSGGVKIREITYGNIFRIIAPVDMTRLIGYARGFDNAVITVTLTKNSRITNIGNRLDELDNEFVGVPVYAENIVKNINTKLVNLQGSQTVTLGFITDIHVHGDTLEDATQNAMLTSMAALNAINRRNPLDLVILNGDYLYNDSSTTKETALEWYDRLAKTVAYLNPPLFIGKGNHDANDITKNLTQYLSDEEIYKVFAKLTTADYVGNYGYLEKSYGYYDIPNKKVRIIIIDTVDIPLIIEDESLKYSEQHTICISNEQLGFIADALKFVDSGWGVVFVSHHAIQNGSGINPNESADVYVPLNHGGNQLLGIINAYRNKTSYTDASGSGDFVYDVSVDYSDNKSDEVIAMLSGHTHRDLYDVINGILMVSATAASFIYTAYYADGTVIQRTSQTESETSWDIVTIDRAAKKLYLTRYGAGTDRVFDY